MLIAQASSTQPQTRWQVFERVPHFPCPSRANCNWLQPRFRIRELPARAALFVSLTCLTFRWVLNVFDAAHTNKVPGLQLDLGIPPVSPNQSGHVSRRAHGGRCPINEAQSSALHRSGGSCFILGARIVRPAFIGRVARRVTLLRRPSSQRPPNGSH